MVMPDSLVLVLESNCGLSFPFSPKKLTVREDLSEMARYGLSNHLKVSGRDL